MAGLGKLDDFNEEQRACVEQAIDEAIGATEPPTFDKEQVYDEQVAPLLKQAVDICVANGMPVAVSVCFCNTEEKGSGFCTTVIGDRTTKWLPDRLKGASVVLQEERIPVLVDPRLLVQLLEAAKRDPKALDGLLEAAKNVCRQAQ